MFFFYKIGNINQRSKKKCKKKLIKNPADNKTNKKNPSQLR